MKERLVKGRHVRGVIDILEAHGQVETLPELSPHGAELVRKPVYPTTWYTLRAFDDLLQSVHRYIYDGSESAGQRMGAMLAGSSLDDKRLRLTLPTCPEEAGQLIAEFWRAHFNFAAVEHGEANVEDGKGVRIRVTGFPDMSACHGQVLMGFCLEALRRGTGSVPTLHVEERPWMHNGVLTFTLSTPAG